MKKRSITAPVVGAAAVLAAVLLAFPVIRARAIVAAVGELPEIPGCPLHALCAAALESGTLNPFAGSPLEGAFAAVSAALASAALTLAGALANAPLTALFAGLLALAGAAALAAGAAVAPPPQGPGFGGFLRRDAGGVRGLVR